MSTGAYHVFGAGQADLLGRQKEIASIRRRWLTKHISIVGPRNYGKTVLMEHLVKMAASETGFSGVALWRVRKNPPKDDAAFWRKLYQCLKSQIPASHEHLPKDIEQADAETMLDAFGYLKEAGQRILLLWDGVDESLMKGGLSNHLWDQLTALADMQAASLILSSRRRLMDLLTTEEARGSDFWRRFDIVLPLDCFKEADWTDVLAPLAAAGVELDPSARQELVNWTGGIPLLTAALLGELHSEVTGKCVLTKADVEAAADKVRSDGRCVKELWRDLDTEIQNEFAEICRKDAAGGTPRSEVDATILAELRTRGLVAESGNKFRPAVRLLACYAVISTNPMPKLRALFGTSDAFIANAQGILDLRLAQAGALNTDLKYHVSQIFRTLDHPSTAMEMMRGVFDRTATLLLRHNFPKGNLPSPWVEEWNLKGLLDPQAPDQRDHEILACRVPQARPGRRRLLRLLAEKKPDGRTVLRTSTYRLMDFVSDAGNYGHHACDVDEEIPFSFAVSACFAAVELCHHLVEDLNNGSVATVAAKK